MRRAIGVNCGASAESARARQEGESGSTAKPFGLWSNLLLLLIAAALVSIATRPYLKPQSAHAQQAFPYPFYIEPGTQMLRAPDGSKQVLGRVVVDMRNGQIWGFPTLTPDTYPSNPLETKPQVSHPFVLGRFAFEDTDRLVK